MKTVQAICQIFSAKGIPYRYYEQTQEVGLVITLKDSSQFPVFIQERNQGAWLDICVPKLLQVQDSVFKGVIFQTLLTHTYETAMVRYYYNPKDGSINASVDLPLLDMNLSERSLMFCLNLLVESLNDIMPRLRSVLATGCDPGRKSEIEQFIEQMSPEALAQMAQLIAMRQQGGGDA